MPGGFAPGYAAGNLLPDIGRSQVQRPGPGEPQQTVYFRPSATDRDQSVVFGPSGPFFPFSPSQGHFYDQQLSGPCEGQPERTRAPAIPVCVLQSRASG